MHRLVTAKIYEADMQVAGKSLKMNNPIGCFILCAWISRRTVERNADMVMPEVMLSSEAVFLLVRTIVPRNIPSGG